jgi:hypothetical protein
MRRGESHLSEARLLLARAKLTTVEAVNTHQPAEDIISTLKDVTAQLSPADIDIDMLLKVDGFQKLLNYFMRHGANYDKYVMKSEYYDPEMGDYNFDDRRGVRDFVKYFNPIDQLYSSLEILREDSKNTAAIAKIIEMSHAALQSAYPGIIIY